MGFRTAIFASADRSNGTGSASLDETGSFSTRSKAGPAAPTYASVALFRVGTRSCAGSSGSNALTSTVFAPASVGYASGFATGPLKGNAAG